MGSHLVRRLVQEKIKTRCLTRVSSNIEPLKALGMETVYGDVSDKDSLKKAMQEVFNLKLVPFKEVLKTFLTPTGRGKS